MNIILGFSQKKKLIFVLNSDKNCFVIKHSNFLFFKLNTGKYMKIYFKHF